MRKIFRKYIILIITVAIALILVGSIHFSKATVEEQQRRSFQIKLAQMIHTLKINQDEIEANKMNLEADYLTRAKVANYVVEQNEEMLHSSSELNKLAELLDVDEIHIIDENGIITYSSVAKYVGLDFHDGEQTEDFLILLDDSSGVDVVNQESQPNMAEGKVMKYIGIARTDKVGIVQIGLEPVRLMEAQERNTYEYIFSRFPADMGEEMFAIDSTTNELVGYVASGGEVIIKNKLGMEYDADAFEGFETGGFVEVGKGKRRYVVTREYNGMIIGASIPESDLYENLYQNTGLILFCLVGIAVVLILLIDYLLKRKVIDGIEDILEKLDAISGGDLTTTVDVGGNPEFEQLSQEINGMVENIINSSNRLSRIIELSHIPLGAFDYRIGMQQVFITSRLSNILHIEEVEMRAMSEEPEAFLKMIHDIMEVPVENEIGVFEVRDNYYVRLFLVENEDGYLGVVTDATRNVITSRQIRYENDHDHLTGLYCYSRFKDVAGRRLISRKDDELCVAVMLDMDAFKQINDTYGHEFGDVYIKNFANLLLRREQEYCLVARRSGDEFCMFMSGCKDKTQILDSLALLWGSLGENLVESPDGNRIRISISGGYAFAEAGMHNVDILIGRADRALYYAKEHCKGEYVEFKN